MILKYYIIANGNHAAALFPLQQAFLEGLSPCPAKMFLRVRQVTRSQTLA